MEVEYEDKVEVNAGHFSSDISNGLDTALLWSECGTWLPGNKSRLTSTVSRNVWQQELTMTV